MKSSSDLVKRVKELASTNSVKKRAKQAFALFGTLLLLGSAGGANAADKNQKTLDQLRSDKGVSSQEDLSSLSQEALKALGEIVQREAAKAQKKDQEEQLKEQNQKLREEIEKKGTKAHDEWVQEKMTQWMLNLMMEKMFEDSLKKHGLDDIPWLPSKRPDIHKQKNKDLQKKLIIGGGGGSGGGNGGDGLGSHGGGAGGPSRGGHDHLNPDGPDGHMLDMSPLNQMPAQEHWLPWQTESIFEKDAKWENYPTIKKYLKEAEQKIIQDLKDAIGEEELQGSNEFFSEKTKGNVNQVLKQECVNLLNNYLDTLLPAVPPLESQDNSEKLLDIYEKTLKTIDEANTESIKIFGDRSVEKEVRKQLRKEPPPPSPSMPNTLHPNHKSRELDV